MDSDTEIDPDLFLKCRLCINNTGLYQINQSLQQYIKFCFDITVKHADCLSQLLCKQCKQNVLDFNTAKIQYLENQNILSQKLKAIRLAKAEKGLDDDSKKHCSFKENSCDENNKGSNRLEENKCAPKLNVVNRTVGDVEAVEDRTLSSSEHEEVISNNKKPKKRKNILLSTSSSNVSDVAVVSEVSSHASNQIAQKTSSSWKECYKKKFMCRFCNLMFSTKKRINKHIRRHSKLIQIQKHLTKTICKIVMEKVEDVPNLTGKNNAVVLTSDNILMNNGTEKYCVKYLPKLKNDHLRDERKMSLSNSREIHSDNSSGEDSKIKPRKKKRRRLRTSSNETVVINANTSQGSESNEKNQYSKNSKNEDSSDVQCINVEDSSNDSSQFSKHTGQTQEKDLRIVYDIISGCCKKYSCNRDNEAQNDNGKKSFDLELINKKFYSTGRKVIMSTGVGTPGLIKYLKYKNVPINWTPLPNPTNMNKPVVRIMAKVALPEDTNKSVMPNSSTGWLLLKDNNAAPEKDVSATTLNNSPVNEVLVETVETTEEKTVPKNNTPHHDMANIIQIKLQKDQVTLNTVQQLLETDSVKSKLLNASPVANPKQLPKKNVLHEAKNNALSAESNNKMSKNNSDSIFIDSDDEIEHNEHNNQNSHLHMPIITSTTSLAPVDNPVNEQPNTTIQNHYLKTILDKPVLRLKCKPVSELMPQSSSVSLLQNATVKDNTVRNESFKIVNVPALLPIAPRPPNIQINSGVIMNSVDLPNTSTQRPIEYFKTLLQMRNLTLLTKVNHKLSKDFSNLVKFRLELTQFEKSVILGLALFANDTGVIFCLKIGNVSEEMDIDILPAHWQVRILKSFRGEVSKKILECAQKINSTLHDNARQFVLLLQNIEFKSDINSGK